MNKKINKRGALLIAVFVLLLISGCILIMVIRTNDKPAKKSSNKIGLILTGGKSEKGWNGTQYESLKSACEQYDYSLITKEYVGENTQELHKAVKELIDSNVSAIFLNSYNYPDIIADTINANKDIQFFAISSDHSQDNLHSFFARMYQVRYLSGIVAGLTTTTNEIGYVAAMENSEVIRGIDAFTLGVTRVNKKATVNVIFTDSWNDESKERESVNRLIDDKNADVITYHQNQTYVVDECEKNGIYSIGYNHLFEAVSEKNLTSVICDWNTIYNLILKDFKRHNIQKNYWLGLESDAVMLSEYSSLVSQEAKDEVDKATKEILEHNPVFSDQIYDNNNIRRCDNGEIISDTELFNKINWYTKGVEIYD